MDQNLEHTTIMENVEKSTRDWINKYLHTKIEDEKYTEFWNFVILWNLFEARLFNKNDVLEKSKELQLQPKLIDSTLKYFQSRYVDIEKGTVNSKFNALRLRSNDHPAMVKNVLLGMQNDIHDIIAAIIIIIYRYRNNLFHGTKNIANLPKQEDNFIHANDFLIVCLEAK